MKPQGSARQFSRRRCLSDMDLYNYYTRTPGDRNLTDIEIHLSSCSHCQGALADLIVVLHPDPDLLSESIPEPSHEEIQETLALIQRVNKGKPQNKVWAGLRTGWLRWGRVAASAAIIVGLASWGVVRLRDIQKSRVFYAEARTQLQGFYTPQSPSGLRLNLPFESTAMRSDSSSKEAVDDAENLFHQTLAVRADMAEAHLGLGYIYLRKTQFSRARAEFQKAADASRNDSRASMGRAVALYEEALVSKDPVFRSSCLNQALADFEGMLSRDSASSEARYNKCLALYETGRHKEALHEIEEYLVRDPASSWAECLKAVKIQIQLRSSAAMEKEIDRSILTKDEERLKKLARLLPYRMPEVIRKTLRRSIENNGNASVLTPKTQSSDLYWAAGIMESAYQKVSGDRSHEGLLKFYARLPPAEIQAKSLLDAKFQSLVDLHKKGDLSAVLRASQPLETEFDRLHDYWQLTSLHHLRGNCFYYNHADSHNALEEYRKMLRCAEQSGAPDLIAGALGTLSTAYLAQSRFDDAGECITKMQKLSIAYRLDSWAAFAYRHQGMLYQILNQLEDSLSAYSSALSLIYHLMDEQLLIVTIENMGAVLERMERFDAARDLYREAMRWQDFFIQNGSERSVAAISARRANLLYRQGGLDLRARDFSSAETCFKQGLEIAGAGMREIIANIRCGLVHVYLEKGDFSQAQAELNPALAITASGEFPEVDWVARTQAGVLSRRLGDDKKAFSHFEHAIKVLEEMRQHVSSRELRYAFLERRYDPYQELVALSFFSEKNPSKALAYADRAKSSTLRELLERKVAHFDLDQTAAAPAKSGELPAGCDMVEYFFLADKLLIFISGSDGVQGFSQPVSQAGLHKNIQKYLESIRTHDAKTFDALSRGLYDTLMAPIAGKLESHGSNALVLIPDGSLHLLPFASLRDSNGRYLLEKYSLTFAPSQSVLRHCLSLNKGSASAQNPTLLLMNASSSLPGASDELAFLAKTYGGRATVIGPENPSSQREVIRNSAIIHFAGHAKIFQGKPRLMFGTPPMETYAEASTIGDWALKNTRLVWLAGCNTGIGPVAQGETPWGLVPAFLSAGAPAVIASLLPVDDLATRSLTIRFYDLLAHASVSKAKALQQAQLSMLKETSPANSQPWYWAPFVLVGDPR